MRRLGLRLRMAAFFAALALGAMAAAALGLLVAHGRLDGADALSPLIVAGAIAGFGTLGLTALIWLLFDENVARPLVSLAGEMRTRAHGDVTAPLDPEPVRHLGDLGPAAAALAERLARARGEADGVVARATARLAAEKAQLSAILSEIPVGILAVGPTHRITLYDRQCVHLLGGVAPLGLNRSVFNYLDRAALTKAMAALATGGARFEDAELPMADGSGAVRARIRPIGGEGGYLLAMEIESDPIAERPLVFDFDLIDRPADRQVADTPLSGLCCVVFDTETTGLSPETDEIVQIGAVRVLNGRRIEAEVFETLVNPGRPIPPSSTRVHGIDDAAVAGAPDIAHSGRAFHRFVGDSVLVAHNAPFDLGFLRRHEAKIGARFDNPVLDTVLLSAAVWGEGVPHTLDAIAERLGVRLDPALRHTATGDAVATADVLLHLIPVLEAAGIRSFGDAVAAMRHHQRLLPDLNG
ncbi:3'-5' exonuclease [Roseitranquillus sediminis]|uniref:3'-5' exonuclease n=1 Tax=Roseitranquillus sediminis TaxID=2809051 RepID=UPI001D0C38DC|nr:exonuclease domain-containing protein [Roseitranquillus sediminis]MBM9596056.1 3'-5' exonuclease [Roseitranquillus sediminis]